jgi:hypothetical protein
MITLNFTKQQGPHEKYARGLGIYRYVHFIHMGQSL